jgi:hypothetical protein
MARAAGRGQLVWRSPHATVHFKMDRRGIQGVALSAEVGDACRDWAQHKAKPFAISISPRSQESGKTHYADSFEVHSVLVGAPPSLTIIGRPPMLRAGAILINTSPYAVAVEYGGKRAHARQTSHRVLGKTLARFRRPVKPSRQGP